MTTAQFTSEIKVELTGQFGDDLRICRQAWVSNLAEQAMNHDASEERQSNLIRDLMTQKHGSPFEAGYFEFFISAPRGVRDEHVRHRIGSYSSASSRYREIPPLFYIPAQDRPLKKTDGFKKMRPVYEAYDLVHYELYRDAMQSMYQSIVDHIDALKEGGFTATEAIRFGNPDGQLIPYIARFNPRSMMHFLALRTHDEHANHPSYPMYEIEVVARQIETHFASHLPLTHHWFNEAGREAP